MTAPNATDGHIEDFRVVKGYTSQRLVPHRHIVTAETVLMARFDGTNGATTFEDDAPFQDIRFSGGATAEGFTLVDYTDFGAEISIGSKCIQVILVHMVTPWCDNVCYWT